MLARYLAPRLERIGIHYGWVIVAVTLSVSVTTAGAIGVPGALILPLTKEYGWDVAQISSALAVRLVLFGLMAPFAAALIERYGVRNVVLTAVAMIVAGLLLALGMQHVWQLVLSWGIIIGLGTGLTALVLGAIVSTRWFTERRGLVLGILTAANATGQLIFLPLAASLLDRVDYRWLLFWYYGLRGLSLLALPHTTFTLYGMSVFAAFYGLDWIATVPPTVRLAAKTFGPERAGIVFGWVFTAHQLGAAIAAFGAGLTRTELLTYLPAFYAAGGACIIAAALVLLIRKAGPQAIAPVTAVAQPAT